MGQRRAEDVPIKAKLREEARRKFEAAQEGVREDLRRREEAGKLSEKTRMLYEGFLEAGKGVGPQDGGQGGKKS